MFTQMGIGGRLLLAFFGISTFAVLVGAVALYSFIQVGGVISRISEIEAPEAITSLELSRQAERMVRAAPSMLTVSNLGQQQQIQSQIAAESERLDKLLTHLKQGRTQDDVFTTIEWSVTQLRNNLNDLNTIVVDRLRQFDSREKLSDEFNNAYTRIQRLLSEAIAELDYKLERKRAMNTNSDVTAHESDASNRQLVELLISRATLQAASQHLSTIHRVFLETQLSDLRAEQLSMLSVRGQTALDALNLLTDKLDSRLTDPIETQLVKIHEFMEGENSIFSLLKKESSAETRARDVLIENSWFSEEMSTAVDDLVAGTKQNMTDAIAKARSAQQTSTWAIMIIVPLSLIFSTLIVWLYVERNLVARLTELSTCMESVAGGDLRIDLPHCKTNDEIGRMTKALTIFRDTAVEIEENNLREIGQARQRLLDAIESISEGFCCFDAHDRLIVANNRFRSLLYRGMEDTVVEGTTFEKLIRQAAERGLIKDAQGRIEEWVAERLAKHRNPGAPHIQQRTDGRWIMVSERATGDGGTVSIYSDITDLKQREAQLTEKSNSMEQLSRQIAKYLSPQVYESIFTGKKEVKVASRRRKLSIFFSDIAGFTETADQMESEELTKLLNHYLTEMSQIALQYGATIDKYVGDAIVIFFGDPESRGIKQDALSCVKMAIAMRDRMKKLQDIWRNAGIAKPLQCRIGINTGFCTVGNFGSEDRMDYTIIGNGVNIAARLEGAATPGEILISHETYALVKDEIRCDRLGGIEVKGISHPVETYQVVATYEKLVVEHELIHEEFPNFNLDIRVEEMSADDRRKAAAALNRALQKLVMPRSAAA